jgi:hypothetical protein
MAIAQVATVQLITNGSCAGAATLADTTGVDLSGAYAWAVSGKFTFNSAATAGVYIEAYSDVTGAATQNFTIGTYARPFFRQLIPLTHPCTGASDANHEVEFECLIPVSSVKYGHIVLRNTDATAGHSITSVNVYSKVKTA